MYSTKRLWDGSNRNSTSAILQRTESRHLIRCHLKEGILYGVVGVASVYLGIYLFIYCGIMGMTSRSCSELFMSLFTCLYIVVHISFRSVRLCSLLVNCAAIVFYTVGETEGWCKTK